MSTPKVSVMLPSYKHPLWVGETIESVQDVPRRVGERDTQPQQCPFTNPGLPGVSQPGVIANPGSDRQ